jgi:hypothetical protein
MQLNKMPVATQASVLSALFNEETLSCKQVKFKVTQVATSSQSYAEVRIAPFFPHERISPSQLSRLEGASVW